MDTGGFYLGVKQLDREADHSSPPSAEVKNGLRNKFIFPPTESVYQKYSDKENGLSGNYLHLHGTNDWFESLPGQ